MGKTNFYKQRKDISLNELSKLITQAIENEHFFNKETLIPKIKNIMAVFNLNMNFTRFNAIKSPSETAKIIKSGLAADWEKKYWKDKLHSIVGDEKMEEFYKERDQKRKEINLINE